jgi:hypothetical protein
LLNPTRGLRSNHACNCKFSLSQKIPDINSSHPTRCTARRNSSSYRRCGTCLGWRF